MTKDSIVLAKNVKPNQTISRNENASIQDDMDMNTPNEPTDVTLTDHEHILLAIVPNHTPITYCFPSMHSSDGHLQTISTPDIGINTEI